MTDTAEAIANGEQAKYALERWLDPAFETVMAEYQAKMTEVAAASWGKDTAAKIEKLALAQKVSVEVRRQIEQVVMNGKIAAEDLKRANKMAELSHEQRRWFER